MDRWQMAAVSAASSVIILLGATIGLTGAMLSSNASPRGASFSFDNRTYNFTYVATTLPEQEKGLMNLSVTNSTFELFVFPNASIYPFWMMDTYTPLDIIWINGSRVVYIVNATPCSWYSPNQTDCDVYNTYSEGHYADYVIEARAGFVNSTGIRPGDLVGIDLGGR